MIVFSNFFRFFALIFAQLFIVNNINLGGANYYISPIIYISFLLTLPIGINKYLLLFLAFLLGLTMDIFLDTYGIHASACVVLAFVRSRFNKRLEQQNTFQEYSNLSIYTMDSTQYLIYATTMVGSFTFWLFLLEEFSFSHLFLLIIKTILSTVVSVTLILIGQYLFFKKPKN